MLTLTLPYPPTVNNYYAVVRGRKILSKKGRLYQRQAETSCYGLGEVRGRVSVYIDVYPPDNRRRDLDNLLKPTLDALVAGGVIEDDSHIDLLGIRRREVEKDGKIVVAVDAL